MKQLSAEVLSNEQLLPPFAHAGGRATLGSRLIWLRCPEIAAGARPGQFVMVRCGEELTLPRPFSIHQVSREGIAIFYAVWADGKGTPWLAERKEKDSVAVFGPLGNGFEIPPEGENLLLVAGGTGIAPLCFLAQEAVKQKRRVTLLLGARTEAQLYPPSLVPDGIKLVTTTDDGKGMVTQLLPDFTGGADAVFSCGPLAMYRTMAQMPELKEKPAQVSLEIMMGCGIGVCYGCTVRTTSGLKQACKDGPIFNLNEVLWTELRE